MWTVNPENRTVNGQKWTVNPENRTVKWRKWKVDEKVYPKRAI
ncbi:hypothetical protein [Neobacillus novalis]|nr:hypothetical protein [Neobacillus novalis]